MNGEKTKFHFQSENYSVGKKDSANLYECLPLMTLPIK